MVYAFLFLVASILFLGWTNIHLLSVVSIVWLEYIHQSINQSINQLFSVTY